MPDLAENGHSARQIAMSGIRHYETLPLRLFSAHARPYVALIQIKARESTVA
jgi:hypothetical protein